MKKLFFFLTISLLPYLLRAQGGGCDYSFNTPAGTSGVVNAIVIQPDEKIIVVGTFARYGTTTVNRIVRIDPSDASIDGTFSAGTGANISIQSCALQPDGKILIGGYFSSYNGITRRRLARLNSNGSLDTSFDPGNIVGNIVQSIVVQPDGKILVAGLFSDINGSLRKNIARLNADGSIDTSFDPGTGADDFISKIVVQPDGKILLGGAFTIYNGTTRHGIARLNADGSLDASFDPGTGADELVSEVLLLADGKILIGGGFTGYNGVAVGRIARLQSDGSLDASFDAGTGADYYINAMAIQADGRIIVTGMFAHMNEITRRSIARLNPDGSQDLDFNPDEGGADHDINTCAIQADGKILIGGSFSSYAGVQRKSLARVYEGCGIKFKAQNISICNGDNFVYNGHTYTTAGAYVDTLQTSLGCDSFVVTILKVNNSGTYDNVQVICAGSSYSVGTHTYTTTGTYRDTLVTTSGCDSIVVTRLTILPATLSGSETICQGASHSVNGNVYTTSGVYTDVVNINGCNISFITTLTVTAAPVSYNPKTICAGKSYSYNGHTYANSGTYNDTIQNWRGCDSIVVTQLTVTPAPFSHNPKTICVGSSYLYNGHSYTEAGTYKDTILTTAGCDSIVITELSLSQPDISVTHNGFVLTANATSAIYQWLDADDDFTPLAGATGATYTATTNGNFAVAVTENNCTDTSAVYHIVVAGLKQAAVQQSIHLSPNPAHDRLNLALQPGTIMKSVRIMNANGQVQEMPQSEHIDITLLSQGVYIVLVETDSGMWREQFVKY